MPGPTLKTTSISRQMLVATAIAVGSALVLMARGLFVWDRYVFRRYVGEELATTAEIVADASQIAVSFGDATAATDTLGLLRTASFVELGCLYTHSGELLAHYATAQAATCPEELPAEGTLDEGTHVSVSRAVLRDKQTIGRLYVRRSLADVESRLRQRLGFLVLITGVCLALGLRLSNRLRESITSPIMRLADTARRVSEGRDYSVRAVKDTPGEIGILVDSFNGMLQEIEARTSGLEEASRLKDEFMAQLSHELRTPLNAILGWSSMLRSGDVDPEKVQKGLEVIDRNAHSQLRIVDDLLDISRVITGKLEIERAPVSLDLVVRRAIDVVQLAADARHVQITHSADGQPDWVRGDAERLQQVVWNVLSNSIKFTPPGGTVHTTIRVGGDRVELTVSDTGEGIDPQFLPYAFDAFRQASPSSKGSVGLGLGLSLVKQIVTLHGGTVRIENRKDSRGTELVIALPRLERPPSANDGSAHPFSRI